MIIALGLAAFVVVGALAYWELVVAEGVHLGPRIVTLLYDLVARRYNSIKQFTPPYEEWFLGEPLAQALKAGEPSLVLDVATGTGRLPTTLLKQAGFRGRVIGLDSSRAMLAQAARDTHSIADRLTLIWHSVQRLPFDDGVFDAVTCLEALEFFPDTRKALKEMQRVLRPGGLLLATNRVGLWAKFLPGHTQNRSAFEAMLAVMGMVDIRTQTWQVEYDLVWAIKPGQAARQDESALEQVLRCPRCGQALARADSSFTCAACRRAYPIAVDGVIEMIKSK
jgi:ubiquinone/menaquinone biosynthesis C-methylase UbiE